MARLTRKFLSALGVEDETKQDEIIAAHVETVDALKAERDKAKEDADKLAGVQAELDALKAEKAKWENDPYKGQYEDLKAEYDKYKQGIEEKETAAKKETVYRGLLKKAGIAEKRLDAIVKVSAEAIDKLELDDKGEAKDAESIVKGMETEWADFRVQGGSQGTNPATPPSGGSGGGGDDQPSRAAQVAAKFYANKYGAPPKNEGGSKQ